MTEPQYLEAFMRHHGNGAVEVDAVKKAGDPLPMVNKVVARVREIRKQARSDLLRRRDEVWCLFDDDSRDNIANAREVAKSGGVAVGYSNPCFEVWALCHFGPLDAPGTQREMQDRLHDAMPRYHHAGKNGGTPELDYTQIRDLYNRARINAENSLTARRDEDRPNGNPSTDVHVLLDKIRAHGRDAMRPDPSSIAPPLND